MRSTRLHKVIFAIVSVVCIIYAITLIFPFAWMLVNSFKSNMDFFQDIWNIPGDPMVDNYESVWKQMDLPSYFKNSIIVTVAGTTVSVLASSCAAYVIAKYKFPGAKLLYSMAVVVMLIPSIGTIAALYRFMIDTNLYDTHLGLVLLYSGGFGFNFILLHGFFKSISWSYAEAGYIDGASDAQVFFKIMLPQARPGIIAVAIIQAIGIWNDYFNPYMFMQDPKKQTLAVGIYSLVQQQSYAADWPKLFAAMIIATVPVLIVYALFSNKIIENTVAGGLKG